MINGLLLTWLNSNKWKVHFEVINKSCNINYNEELFKSNGIYICRLSKVDTSDVIGFPKGKYGYGLLLCIVCDYIHTSIQMYVSHKNEILIRSMGATDWVDVANNVRVEPIS